MYKLHYKLWLEKDGKVFGEGPYRLLVGILETGSLSSAAKKLNMSYSLAYNLIKKVEKRYHGYAQKAIIVGIKGTYERYMRWKEKENLKWHAVLFTASEKSEWFSK